jgi:hypothetical protein
MNKVYLGNGVCVETRDGAFISFVLTKRHDSQVTDMILLEPEVFVALSCYVEQVMAKRLKDSELDQTINR